MIIFYIVLGFTFFFCYLAERTGKKVLDRNGVVRQKYNIVVASIACLIPVIVSGLRRSVGDTFLYRHWYNNIISPEETILECIQRYKFRGQWLWDVIQVFLKNYLGWNDQAFLFLVAIVTIALVFRGFCKYGDNLKLAIFLFITTGYYLTSMNGIRQYLVATLFLTVFPLIYKKKWVSFFVFTWLAMGIHTSAIVLVILYFVVNRPAWKKMTWLFLLGGMGAYVMYPIAVNLLLYILQGTGYGEMYGSWLTTSGDGVNIMRVIVMFLPVALGYIGRKQIAENEPYFNIVLNMSVLNFVIMLVAMRQWIFARFIYYTIHFMIILLCWEVKYIFKGKQKIFLSLGIYTGYFYYFFYEMTISVSMAASGEGFFFWQ